MDRIKNTSKFIHPVVLPTLKNLFALFYQEEKNHKHPRNSQRSQDYLAFANGAGAIGRVIEELSRDNEKHTIILIPHIFCGQSLRFLRSLNIKYQFYPLTRELTPDIESLHQLCRSNKKNIILLVDFFGARTSRIQDVEAAVSNFDVTIVQDNTHHPIFNKKANHNSAFTIFSPRKHIGVHRGGICFPPKNSRPVILTEQTNIDFTWYLKNMFKAQFLSIKKERKRNYNEIDFDDGNVTPISSEKGISTVEKKLINLFFFGYGARQRAKSIAQNYAYLRDMLSGEFKIYPAVKMREDEIPYGLPLQLHSQKHLQILKILKENRIPVMVWPEHPTELRGKLDPKKLQFLVFFVHEQINIHNYIQQIRSALKKANAKPKN